MFSLEDIPEQYREGISENDSADTVYKKFYKKVDARTKSVRKYVKEFVKETKRQLKGIEDKAKELSPEQKEEIKALITARAFQIKTRACGISDRFTGRVEEYKKEIAAYRELYEARYRSNDPNFSDVGWLKKAGYESMAETYIPFSKERESKIFTLAGIKRQAEGATRSGVDAQTKGTREGITNPDRGKNDPENGKTEQGDPDLDD